MYKASPRVFIPEWEKEDVTAVETITAVEFVSLSTSYARMREGFATITNAAMPDWQLYDRGRVVFTHPEIADVSGDDGVTLELLAQDADENIYTLGVSHWNSAGNYFPPIEFDVTYERYALRVAGIDIDVTAGDTATEVSVGAAVQGFYRSGLATT